MKKRIYVPTSGPDDWRRLLADPDKHWRAGYSARELAERWEAADGFPPEVEALFTTSGSAAFHELELLLAIPEHQVSLAGRGKPSQNDLFVLARCADGGLMAIMVEGKAAEPFGPTVGEWLDNSSPGKTQRLAFLQAELRLEHVPPTCRYQLLHRSVSALLEARRFNATRAMLLVHSFSAANAWFADYAVFAALFGAKAEIGQLVQLRAGQDIELYAAWVTGPRAAR